MNNVEDLDKKFRALHGVKELDARHNSDEARYVMEQLFSSEAQGDVIELGAYRGAMTVKLSLIATCVGKRLYVLDSFCGLPQHSEKHGKTTDGRTMGFPPGDFGKTSLETIKANVERYGEISACEFVPGFFEDTLPTLVVNMKERNERVAFVFCDVDLAYSTATCLKYLWPTMAEGGIWITHDGRFPWCREEYQKAGIDLFDPPGLPRLSKAVR